MTLLIDELVGEKEKSKLLNDEMEATLHDIQNMYSFFHYFLKKLKSNEPLLLSVRAVSAHLRLLILGTCTSAVLSFNSFIQDWKS